MARNPDVARTISRITWGITRTISGLVLYQLALGIAVATTPGGKTSRTAGKALLTADELADKLFIALNPDQFQSAFQALKRRGLINSIKGKRYETMITKEGLKRLSGEIPVYKENRPWDKRIYLVTYDIEEEFRVIRNGLRGYLKDIGCAPLQKSTYLAVYNPRGLLRSWLGRRLTSGDVLVSDLGPDGSLGDRPLTELVADAYGLQRINLEYERFLAEFSVDAKDDPVKKQQAFFRFNGILAQDPQLPFELLPDWWSGDRAYRRYQQIVGDFKPVKTPAKTI